MHPNFPHFQVKPLFWEGGFAEGAKVSESSDADRRANVLGTFPYVQNPHSY